MTEGLSPSDTPYAVSGSPDSSPDARNPGDEDHRFRMRVTSALKSARRLKWHSLIIVAVLVLAGLAPHAGKSGIAANRSGLSWVSGAYPPDDTPAGAAAFGTWRGHPLAVVDAWSARATWAQIIDPAWLYRRWQKTSYIMAFGVAMLPEDVTGVSLQACASGSYDGYWRKFGQVISSYGLGKSIIRLGWEFNGNWYVWQASDPATWARCWQQIVTSARSTAPGLQWDWNVNRGVSRGLGDPVLAYPGNAYVSMIGIDSYDSWPPATTAAGWQVQLNGKQGLNYWLAFAKAHGKLLSVPEWGNVYFGVSAGGDDALYVQDMRTFFATNAAAIAFECNFQGPLSSGDASYGSGTLVPKASAAYKTEF
jgi:hypothetical protein